MFEKLSNQIANMLVKNRIIQKNEFEIYRYGFEMLIYFIINISIILFISIIFNKTIQTIIFLICYCTLRQFTGGYHARNYTECTLTFVLMYLSTIFISNNIDIDKFNYIPVLIIIVSLMIINTIAPLDNRNKPITKIEKKYYKKITQIIVLVISTILILSIVFNIYTEYTMYSLFSITWVAILLILGLKQKNTIN